MKDNKINVELLVPSIKEKYNISIPVSKTIGEVIIILNKTINELNNSFPVVNNLSLLNVIENKIYDINIDILSSGIKNGAILALI